MSEQNHNFDDPGLKSALAAVYGDHVAKPDLKAQVMRRLAQARVEDSVAASEQTAPAPLPFTTAAPSQPRRFPWKLVGTLAALIALSVSAFLYNQHMQEESAEYAHNAAIMGEMVALHDLGTSESHAIRPLAGTDAATVAREAQTILSRAIPTPDLSRQSWTLASADICKIGSVQSARFRFTRGSDTITLLSFPASVYEDADEGDHYETTVDGHPIAGYVRDGSLNCIVGSEGSELKHIIELRDALRS